MATKTLRLFQQWLVEVRAHQEEPARKDSGKHSGQRHTHIHIVYMPHTLSWVKMHWESLTEQGNGCVQGTDSKEATTL